jgi:hypothetical protein
MALQMGAGEAAYRLTMGEQARRENLVAIFDTGPDINPVFPTDQTSFYEHWLASLPSKPSASR